MRTKLSIMGVLMATALTATPAIADDFELSWSSLDGGGTLFAAHGDFELSGTIGQPDAGWMTDGVFELQGGFWAGVGEPPPCPADVDGDGVVGVADLARLLGAFGYCAGEAGFDADADFDASGCVDIGDLAFMLNAFGEPC